MTATLGKDVQRQIICSACSGTLSPHPLQPKQWMHASRQAGQDCAKTRPGKIIALEVVRTPYSR